MSMSLQEAEQVDRELIASRGSGAATVLHELLWLRAIFVEQRRRTPAAERRRFDQRADLILARLAASACAVCLSDATLTVRQDDKR
jgi:hypothetical protein